MIETKPEVKIDLCHLDLIYGLMVSQKPVAALELGMGSGIVTDVMIKAFRSNQSPINLTCVDNWLDWNGIRPKVVEHYEAQGVRVVTSTEKDFVYSETGKYDFIVSDADHDHSQEWFERTLMLLNKGGILIYHDVTNPLFANLYELVRKAERSGFSYLLFNRSSRQDEKCERGLLVISTDRRTSRPFYLAFRYKLKQIFRAMKGFFNDAN